MKKINIINQPFGKTKEELIVLVLKSILNKPLLEFKKG